MTQMSTFLEDFGTFSRPPDAVAYSDETLETERLESFDKGYRAGWDDAIKAKLDDDDQHAHGLVQSLQDVSFTYHEAQSQIIATLAPLFEQISGKLLPTFAKDMLGPHLVERLTTLARDATSGSVKLVVAPGGSAELKQLLDTAQISLPVCIEESDLMGPGQANLQLDEKRIAVNLDEVALEIGAAVKATLSPESESYAHG